MIIQARILERGGADCLLLGANTMHKWFEPIQNEIDIPVLHIADATANAIKGKKLKKVALLGTKVTMEQDFYKSRLKNIHEIETIVSGTQQRDYIADSILMTLL